MEKEKLYRYTGHPQQLYSLRRVILDEGRAKGTTVLEVTTAGGLQMDILPDTGFDIGQVRYKGVNMSFISKNGYDSPFTYSAAEGEFVNSFPGGMLCTCGLRNVGPGCNDGGAWHPLHGRIHTTPAEQVSGCIENNCFVISGVLRETALFGHALELRRRIEIPVFGSEIEITDTLTNLTSRAEEFMLLYHFNFGYPMLSKKAKLTLPAGRETLPRSEFAKEGLGRECRFDDPVDGEQERVYFHHLPESWANLSNSELGISAELSWNGGNLPILTQWRSLASGDYVLGLEPSNCYVMGRAAERENGSLKELDGFSSIKYQVNLSFNDLNKKEN